FFFGFPRAIAAGPARTSAAPGDSGGASTSFVTASAMTLFLPGVGVVVVAAHLPVARLVDRDEADAGEPRGALPEVEVGDERADGGAVRARERRALVLVRDEHVRRERLGDPHVRGVARVRL